MSKAIEVIVAPDGRPLRQLLQQMPADPSVDDDLVFAPPSLLSLAAAGDCDQIDTLRIAFPPTTAPPARMLPFDYIALQHQ